MSLIQVRNLLHENAPSTRLSNAEVSGTNALRVENTNGLTTSWAVQIGEVGGEQTEVIIGTVSSGSITNSATTYPHPADTPLYFIKYNQVVFERSTAGTAGTAAPMTNGTISYQPDSQYTVFDDTSGSSTYGYRTYFRNSTLAVNSTESDWITFAGPNFYTLGKMRERVKEKLWNATWLTDDMIDNWLNEWKDEMNNEAVKVNEDYRLGTVDVAFDSTDGYGTVTTGDFYQPRRLWTTNDGVNWYNSTKMDINSFVPDQTFSSVNPYHAWLGDSIFQVKPCTTGGTARIVFYRIGTPMANDTDELPVPMRAYTKSFVDYALSQAFLKDGKNQEYTSKLTEAAAGKNQFVSNLAPRDKSGPTKIEIVEPMAGEYVEW